MKLRIPRRVKSEDEEEDLLIEEESQNSTSTIENTESSEPAIVSAIQPATRAALVSDNYKVVCYYSVLIEVKNTIEKDKFIQNNTHFQGYVYQKIQKKKNGKQRNKYYDFVNGGIEIQNKTGTVRQ